MARYIRTRSGRRPRETGVHVRLMMLPSMLGRIDDLAEQEDRTRSEMIRELVAEALRLREYELGLIEQYEQQALPMAS